MIQHELKQHLIEIYSYIYKDVWDPANKRIATSREEPYIHYRHLARYMLQRVAGTGPVAIARAEASIFNRPMVDHSTIIHSFNVVTDELRAKPKFRRLIHEIGFIFDLKNGYRDRGRNYSDTINKMIRLPKTVLAITLASVQHHNLVHKALLETLIYEYSELDATFVANTLKFDFQPEPTPEKK